MAAKTLPPNDQNTNKAGKQPTKGMLKRLRNGSWREMWKTFRMVQQGLDGPYTHAHADST